MGRSSGRDSESPTDTAHSVALRNAASSKFTLLQLIHVEPWTMSHDEG
jgi:hypothetical protein